MRRMRLLVVSLGTRGDIQPFIALGLGLQRRGHQVIAASHREHEPLVASYGLEFRDAGSSMREILESDLGRDWIDSSDSLFRYAKTVTRVMEKMWAEALPLGEAMTEGVDAVVCSVLVLHALHHAEVRKLPTIGISLLPLLSSGEATPHLRCCKARTTRCSPACSNHLRPRRGHPVRGWGGPPLRRSPQ